MTGFKGRGGERGGGAGRAEFSEALLAQARQEARRILAAGESTGSINTADSRILAAISTNSDELAVTWAQFEEGGTTFYFGQPKNRQET